MTPFGPVYNTNSPEWRQAGGNPIVYQQIMEQKMMMQQQQMYMKQQQLYMKQQQQAAKGQNKNQGLNGPAATNSAAANPFTTLPRKKKKRRAYDPTHPVTSGAAASAKTDAKTPAATSEPKKAPKTP